MKAILHSPWIKATAIACLAMATALLIKIWHDTMRDPVVERLVLETAALPAGSLPVSVAFLSDIHVAGPDMPPSRLARIVSQVNALKPDLVVIAGDLVSEKRSATKVYTAAQIVAPLGVLEAKYGVVVVPGNHDHWFDWPALSAELSRHAQISVLANEAVQLGPFAIGGVDDDFTGRADVERTAQAMRRLSGVRLWLSHSPDIFPSVPVDADLVLAGHTHCGQIAYPWGGSPATMSDFGETYACGVVKKHGKKLVTSAGLGTSLLPIRLFTRPEVWLITVRPATPGEDAAAPW